MKLPKYISVNQAKHTNIQGRTICAFGEACAWPVLSFVSKFRDEFESKGTADEATRHVAAGSHA